MKFLTKPENLISLLLILGIVLPWLSFGEGESIAGYRMASGPMGTRDPVFYGVYLIPLLCVFIILANLQGKNTRLLRLLPGVVPLGLFLYIILQSGGVGVMRVFGLAAYITMIAAVGMLFTLRTSVAEGGTATG